MYKLEKTQLFFLHFAGGNCYSYDFLKKEIDSDFEVFSLELPGRGKRLSEDALVDFDKAVLDYLHQIQALRNDQPYLIYGHSMGATLGLFLTKKMEEALDPPIQLIVSGNAGPGVTEIDEDGNEIIRERYLMKDQDFKDELKHLGGIPDEVLQTKELYDFFSPIIRADFEILEKEPIRENIQLVSPIYALMGADERNSESIQNWKRFTTTKFQFKILQGNHFFIYEHTNPIARLLVNSANTLSPVY